MRRNGATVPGRWAWTLTLLVAALAVGACASKSNGFEEQQRRWAAQRAQAEAARPEPRKQVSAEDKIRSADRYRQSGDRDRALVGYLEAFRAEPQNPTSRLRIAYLLLEDEPERAASAFARLIETHPQLAEAHTGLGLAHLAQEHLVEAKASLERALELDPSSVTALHALGVVHDLMGQPEEAREFAERARALAPRDANVANNLGVSRLLAGDLVEAEQSLRAAILLDPGDPVLHNNLGLILGGQGRYEEAMQAFRQAGTEQAAYNNLGYVQYLNGRYAEAISSYERALSAEGDDRRTVLRNLNAALDALEASASP